MSPVAIDTELTAADYLHLTLWTFFRNPFIAFFYGVNLLALVTIVPGIISGRSKGVTVFQVAFQAFIWLGVPCLTFLSSRTAFRKLAPAQRSIRYLFTSDTIDTVTGIGSSTVSWLAIQKVVETSRAFYVSSQKNLYQIVPKRSFKSSVDIERLREMARAHLGRRAKVKKVSPANGLESGV